TGVWIGFDQERSLGKNEVGGRAAAPVWLYYMEKVLRGKPVEAFPVPEGIVFVKVDKDTGFPVRGGGQGGVYECFLENALPAQQHEEAIEEKEELFR
ncbi:MAG TPA: hypothetical protein PKY71_01770, partial [Smithellaceae bacterium]|nr:hypothetical protein [Smithellaceae bacterium]